jgi:hypothetical protein
MGEGVPLRSYTERVGGCLSEEVGVMSGVKSTAREHTGPSSVPCIH